MKPRLVCWYSHGAASLIAAKKAIENQPLLYPDHEVVVACIHLKEEHHEPERYELVEAFLGHKILWLKNEKYDGSVDAVIEDRKYMSGVRGAPCTKELKKQVRIDWQRENDVHVFGFDVNEDHRTDQILDTEPELEIYTPLVDMNLSKKDCFILMREAGIPLPMMYELGYHNNNCKGCVKAAGAGYWNKIRVDFPNVFKTRENQETRFNVALVKMSISTLLKKHPMVLLDMSHDMPIMKVDGGERSVCILPDGTEVNAYDFINNQRQKFQALVLCGWLKAKNAGVRVPLRYLPPDAGSHKDLDIGDCGITCEMKN